MERTPLRYAGEIYRMPYPFSPLVCTQYGYEA